MSLQQVNLYQAEFRQKPDPLSPKRMLLVLAVGLVCGVATLAYTGWEISAKRAHLAKLESDVSVATQKQAKLTQKLASHKVDTTVEQQIKDLENVLAGSAQNEELIIKELASSGSGYSGYFTALAKHSVDQLWLTGITIGPEKSLSLRGQTSAPEAVLQYLRGLSSEPVLNGTQFNLFQLERAPPSPKQENNGTVNFVVSTDVEETLQP